MLAVLHLIDVCKNIIIMFDIEREIKNVESELIRVRRALHRQPELGKTMLVYTCAFIEIYAYMHISMTMSLLCFGER